MSGIDQQWNFADVWEAVADRFPESPAIISGGTTTTWRDFDERSDGIAQALRDAGLRPGAKVALFLYNGPEYLEATFACFKARLVPVNTNYRYTGSELAYLWDNADAEAVIFHSDLGDRCEEVRRSTPGVRAWLWADAGTGSRPDWALSYEEAAETRPGRVGADGARRGDDLFLLYTGGTTGSPKGVMWPQDTLFRMLEELNGRSVGEADAAGRAAELERPGPRVLPAPPLMHGTAMWFAMPALNVGGCVVLVPDRSFDPATLLDVVGSARVRGLCIVGDAFGRPLVEALDGDPDRWDLSGLKVVLSSGVMLGGETKERLLAHAPNAVLIDSLGSSESGGVGSSTYEAGQKATAAAFRVGRGTRVIDADGRDVEPGSGQQGHLAITGHIPIGYYGDPVKTAETFVTIDGVVHVVPGDVAEVDADGTVRLLGRGSVCINTGGEKVFPEEVETALKTLAGVRDAVVVGVPDDRFGQRVVAIVEPYDHERLDHDALLGELRRSLAGYKVPRHVIEMGIGRAPNGKADYRRLTAAAQEELASRVVS